jgi:ribose transport system ATP-binding protein
MIQSSSSLIISNLVKSYGQNNVLDNISLTIKAGSIVGLVGENGAGKSTLAKCIGNHIKYDSGSITFNKEDFVVYTVPQEFTLIKELTVWENIFLGREITTLGFVNSKKMIKEATNLLASLNSNIDVKKVVSSLSVAEKQIVEIAKAFLLKSNLIILDEPTTVLNQKETSVLFNIMKDYTSKGNSIIYISHKLPEVIDICDEIAILRDGVLVDINKSTNFTPLMLAEKMVGRELANKDKVLHQVEENSSVILEVENLSSLPEVKSATFKLKKGEILGVAGLAGSGRTQLAQAICALRHKDGGVIKYKGKIVNFKNYRNALDKGFAYLSEDRQSTACLLDFSITSNISLSSLKKYCQSFFISHNKEEQAASNYISSFRIKTNSSSTLVRNLSGGNQQKVAIAKGLDTNPEIFIFDEPTRGVDINARNEIYSFIEQLAKDGVSCILISSDLEEIISNCARVIVMHQGTIKGQLIKDEITEENIMYLATGVK